MSQFENEIIVKIRFLYPNLTKSEKRVADIILDDFSIVPHYTLAELAKKARCSDTSVLRFCRRLGLDGYSELKFGLAKLTRTAYDNGMQRIETGDDVRTIFEKVIWTNEKTLQDTLTLYSGSYEDAMSAVLEANQINFFGVGDAWIVCLSAQMKFQRIGVRSAAYSDVALSLATASLMGEGDLAVGISFSGETKLVVDALRIAQEGGAKTLAIVHFDKCALLKYADIAIFTATTDFTVGHDEIARRTAELAIIDTLYMGLITKKSDVYNKKLKKTIAAIIENKS
jgi:DNA-binding MurR/RpiR family transcriptional regulator